MSYPNTCTGIHYRISNRYNHCITVGFVLDRNLDYPELGFNIRETLNSYVFNSSQLCFLTQPDAQRFIEKYLGGGDRWTPYISQVSNVVLVRIDRGADSPCYTSKRCCEAAIENNRLPEAVQARLGEQPTPNPFATTDPALIGATQRDQRTQERRAEQELIVDEVLQRLGAQIQGSESESGTTSYLVPLKVDPKKWASYRSWSQALSTPALPLRVVKGKSRMYIEIGGTYLIYLPLRLAYLASSKGGGRQSVPSFWEPLLKTTNRQLGIPLTDNSYYRSFSADATTGGLGLALRPDYGEKAADLPVKWTPGPRNTADRITQGIQAWVDRLEKAADTFVKVAEQYEEEETLELE